MDLVFYGHTHVTQRHCSSYMGACMMNATLDPATGRNVYAAPQYPVYYSIASAGASSDADLEGFPGQPGRKFTAWEAPRSAYARMAVDGGELTVEYVDARTHGVLDTSVIVKAPPACVDDRAGPAASNAVLLSVDGLHQGDLD